MAKRNSNASRGDATLHNDEVSDETVTQVGKAVAHILQLRETFEQSFAAAQTDEERQGLASQVESAALRVISDQGLTVTEYNEVLAAAQSDQDLEERVLSACRAA